MTQIDPAASQNADLLALNGSVQGIDNLTIALEPTNSGASAADYVAANDYVVLTAMTLDGDTPTVVEGGNLPALVDVGIVGTPSTSGQVVLAFSELPATQLAATGGVSATGNPNHQSLANAIGTAASKPGTANQTLANGATLANALSTLTNNQASQLNTLHAESYSSHLTVGLEQLDQLAITVMDNAGGIGFPISGATGWRDGQQRHELSYKRRAWAYTSATRGDIDGNEGLGDFSYGLANLVFGADVVRDPAYTVGVFGAVGRSSMSEHDTIDHDLDTDSYSLGAYGRYHFENGVEMSGALGFMLTETESERQNASVGNFTGGTAKADFDSRGVFAGLKFHKNFERRGLVLTPSAAMIYGRINQDAVNESGGGDFNYDIDEATAESFVTAVGLDVSYPVVSSNETWSPAGFLRYEFDWMADADDEHDIVVSNPVFGSFNQVGQNRGAQGLLVGLGLTYDRGDSFSFGAGYVYAARSAGEEHGLAANLTARW